MIPGATVTQAKAYLMELIRPLAVLALVLFALTQAWPTAAAPDASPASVAALSVALSQSVLCGGGHADDLGHAACHACRSGALLLPPPPSEPCPAFGMAEPVRYGAITNPTVTKSAWRAPQQRAPPAA